MSIGSLNASNYLQSVLSTALQGTGLASNTANTNRLEKSSLTLQPDGGKLSPFAQMLSTLQQLQQSDPSKYQQVAGQIAANLQKAAQTAQSQGNTQAADQLTKLASDFTNASQNNQLPNVQDLAKAMSSHHHHHHMHSGAGNNTQDAVSAPAASSGSSTSDSAAGNSSSSASQALNQLLSAFQSNTTPDDSLNPMAIILNTLSTAGITNTNGQ